MQERSIVLRAERSRDGSSSYRLEARRDADGCILIEGQDIGATPSAFWGSREYEWTMKIPAQAVDRYVEALGGDPDRDDLLDLLSAKSAASERYASRSFLDEAGISYEFWSRVGD